MNPRTIAIGDIHGCSAALDALLEAIRPRPDDTIVTLGDYINRGPDSRGVIERLIKLKDRCRLVPLLGNHEEMLFEALADNFPLDYFLGVGGDATLDSYGPGRVLSLIPDTHLRFLESCLDFHETESHIFVHASYESDLPMGEQTSAILRWEPLRKLRSRAPHFGENGDRRSYLADERRDPRLGARQGHRHLLLRRRLADSSGCPDRGGLAGRP